MSELFIGKKLHWLMAVVIVGLLYWMGSFQFHRVDYHGFLLSLLAIAVIAVAVVLITYRRGDRITRESLEEPED